MKLNSISKARLPENSGDRQKNIFNKKRSSTFPSAVAER